MDEKQKARQFNQALDRYLNASKDPGENTHSEDQEALKTALQLLHADFSREARSRDQLRQRLMVKTGQQRSAHHRDAPLSALIAELSLKNWLGAAVMILLVLTWGLGLLRPDKYARFSFPVADNSIHPQIVTAIAGVPGTHQRTTSLRPASNPQPIPTPLAPQSQGNRPVIEASVVPKTTPNQYFPTEVLTYQP